MAKLWGSIDGFRGSIVIVSSSLRPDLPALLERTQALGSHLILVAENAEHVADTVAARLDGIVCRNVAGTDLLDCVRRGARGQRCLQPPNVAMIEATDSVGARGRDPLTPQEMQ